MIFMLGDIFHESCNNIHTPEEVKAFHNMPISQVNLIKIVRKMTSDAPEGISLKTLAGELGVSAAAASEQVNVLVSKKLLCRRSSVSDRRAICIKLSDEAEKKFKQVEDYLDLKTEEFIREITPEETALLMVLLEKFIKKMTILKERAIYEHQ
ncbi:MAG: MarR family transcriptional regulator [Victivallales bacterium]|nr:MarR family transcriptional regulator [Victivallales bacterium]